ncbi:Tim10/DDP family zinc finger-domain-containing protein [Mycena olivaceomarginata]|uniref:Mitochondrial import inner membrane translocase subunit n=1 Tax=Mycena albidolilacea TaxID=1033008 RepID=A0AAD7AAG2_9AGAR|nr:Tim10/DDP family zinc finger-domain-containing protein [Mycena albidolilacea]KAJ7883055.1 Tim10/DDP family zinc finger-domain-containing protein [Mycena olivaceomarginata]
MNAKKEAVMNAVRNEIALTNAQQLMNSANERCYKACITKPGTSLSSGEQTCLSRCLDRYMEAFNIVRRTYVARLGRERMEDQANVI